MGQMGPPVCLGQIGTGSALLNSGACSSPPLPGWLCQVCDPVFRQPPYPCPTEVRKLVLADMTTDVLFLPHELPLGPVLTQLPAGLRTVAGERAELRKVRSRQEAQVSGSVKKPWGSCLGETQKLWPHSEMCAYAGILLRDFRASWISPKTPHSLPES